MFSLPFGDGIYHIFLFENIIDDKYNNVGTLNFNVKLKNKYAPFLVPNQYINYH